MSERLATDSSNNQSYLSYFGYVYDSCAKLLSTTTAVTPTSQPSLMDTASKSNTNEKSITEIEQIIDQSSSEINNEIQNQANERNLENNEPLNDDFTADEIVEKISNQPPKEESDNNYGDDIDINEVFLKYIEKKKREQENMRKAFLYLKESGKTKAEKSFSAYNADDESKSYEEETKHSEKLAYTRKNVIERKQSITDIFQQRMFSEMMRASFGKTKKNKDNHKTYHERLLDRFLESGLSRGKMVKYVEYNCYNSDDDSEDYENTKEQSLLYRYGIVSSELPSWNDASKKEEKYSNVNRNASNVITEKHEERLRDE